MNRIDRITAILIQLQSKRVVKAQDIAKRFDISLRTVYRDIRTLEEAGIPIVGEAGVGYSMMDGYRLPPVMFSKEEAMAFLTAEKMVEKLTDISTQQSYQSAMFKVRAVLRSTEKDFLENIEEHIEVLENPYLPQNRNETAHLQLVLKSISEKNILTIQYFANHNQEDSTRNIEPVGIYFSSGNWYLIAYCQLRQDYRNFRMDRISSLIPTNFFFQNEHPSLKSFLSKISKDKALQTVVLRVDNEAVKYIGDQKYYNGFVSQVNLGTQTEMTFLTASLKGISRWFLYFGDMAEIVSPDSLKELVKAHLQEISNKMK